MANNSTSFYINLAGNLTAQAAKMGRAVEQMASRSNRALSGMKSSVAAVSNKIDSLGNRTALAVTAAGTLTARSLIKTAAEFEMAAIRMKQTFGEDGDKVFAWVTEFATKTPMEFQDVQDAAMRLKTAGIDPMNGSLQALVDYNARLGGSREELNGYIAAISKANIKGKLGWEEVNPLLERKIPVFELLAKADGNKHSEDFYKDLLSKGKLRRSAIAALLKQMGKDAEGAAEQQMQTWDGMMSNLGDNFTAMQAKIMEKGIFDELKNEVSQVLAWIDQKMESGEFDEIAKQISDGLIAAMKEIKQLAQDAVPVLETVGKAVKWIAEQAGGYGNLAKLLGGLYLANKVARMGITQALGRGAWGLGKMGVGLFRRKGAGNPAGTGLAGSVMGVTPVHVVNFHEMGLGGSDKKGKRRKKRGGRGTTVIPNGKRPNTKPKPTTTQKPKALPAPVKPTFVPNPPTPTPVTPPVKTGSGLTGTLTKTANMAGKVASKALPAAHTAFAVYQGASIMLDDEASVEDKSEAIGSVAGATAGAIIGQALIPVPVVGAVVGSMMGEWLGSWLGSEVGKNLASADEKEAKLNGEIEVKIQASEGLIASTEKTVIKTGRPDSALQMATSTGYMGRGLYGGN